MTEFRLDRFVTVVATTYFLALTWLLCFVTFVVQNAGAGALLLAREARQACGAQRDIRAHHAHRTIAAPANVREYPGEQGPTAPPRSTGQLQPGA